MKQFTSGDNAFEEKLSNVYTASEAVELLTLDVDDKRLVQLLRDNLDKDSAHWNKAPYNLQDWDLQSTKYLLGQQNEPRRGAKENQDKYTDNRLFVDLRAILSYSTAKLAKPSIDPSRREDQFLKAAKGLEKALYQHALDDKVDVKMKAFTAHLVSRKRAWLKMRFDPDKGIYGDVVTEVIDPSDIIVDRHWKYGEDPDRIFHRMRATVEELCNKFPKKKDEILRSQAIIKGQYSQMSRIVDYFECWFCYLDSKGVEREGLAWFLPDGNLILDSQKNPNWIYTGDDKQDRVVNFTARPYKPFTWGNYLPLGLGGIDETCLIEQALPFQMMLNDRLKQFHQNVDYMNGRWVANRNAFTEEDVMKLINHGPKSIGLTNAEDINKAIAVLSPNALPGEVYQSITDCRSEIDTIMGVPAVMRGEMPTTKQTLGRDLLIQQGAQTLNDDLVRAVADTTSMYYQGLLQMMKVYFVDDYWFHVKGGDGAYTSVLLNSQNIDTNVKLSVVADSNLPIDKDAIRATAQQLWQAGQAIDYLTLMEDLGLPNPELRTDRYFKSLTAPQDYLKSIEIGMDNSDAETDLSLTINGKEAPERDNYDQDYMAYLNNFLTQNRFAKLPDDAKQRVIAFIAGVQHLAVQSANLQALNEAGMLEAQAMMPMPGQMPPGAPGQVPGQPPAQPPVAQPATSNLTL